MKLLFKTILIFILCSNYQLCAGQDVQTMITNARDEFANGNYEKSLEICNKIIKKDKRNIEGYFGRAISKEKLKDFEGAEKDYKLILKLDSKYYPAYLNLGILYGIKEKYDLAIKQFNKAEEIFPNEKVYWNRGYVYGNMNENEKAIKDYTRVIKSDSTKSKYFLFRAECYMKLGKSDSCIMDLHTTLKIDSTITIAKVNLGFMNLSIGNLEEAEKYYKSLMITDADNPYVLSNYGFLKHKKGSSDEGEEMIKKSLEFFPDNSYAYKYLALISFDNGKNNDGCIFVNKSLELNYTKDFGNEMLDLKKQKCK